MLRIIIQLCFLVCWIDAKSAQDEYQHDIIGNNEHQQVMEEKDMWLDDFINDKVNCSLQLYFILPNKCRLGFYINWFEKKMKTYQLFYEEVFCHQRQNNSDNEFMLFAKLWSFSVCFVVISGSVSVCQQ